MRSARRSAHCRSAASISSLGCTCLLALATVAGGCAASLSSRVAPDDLSFADAAERPGLVYSLPRTLLSAKITYTLIETRKWHADADNKPIKTDSNNRLIDPLSPPALSIEAAAYSVAPATVADHRRRFRIDPSALYQFQVAVPEAKLTLNEHGVLTGLNIQFADKSAEIAAGLVSTAISVAKIAAAADARPVVLERVEIARVEVERLLDPLHDFSVDGEDLVYSDDDAASDLLGALWNTNVPGPGVAIRLHGAAGILNAAAAAPPDEGYGGVVVAVPRSFPVSIEIGEAPVQTRAVAFAQGGGISVLPIQSGAFQTRTFALKASEVTGQPTEFTSTTSSSGERVANLLKESTAELGRVRGDLLQLQTDLAQKEKSLLEAQKQLEAAKKAAGV